METETETKEEKQIGEMVPMKLDKPVYEKLKASAEHAGYKDPYAYLTSIILDKSREEDPKTREKLAKVMGGKLITANIELFSPYVEFARQYMQFFNIKDSFEIFCMRLIYNELERLHNDLTEFVEDKDGNHFIKGTDWYAKNPHVACTSAQIPDDEE